MKPYEIYTQLKKHPIVISLPTTIGIEISVRCFQQDKVGLTKWGDQLEGQPGKTNLRADNPSRIYKSCRINTKQNY